MFTQLVVESVGNIKKMEAQKEAPRQVEAKETRDKDTVFLRTQDNITEYQAKFIAKLTIPYIDLDTIETDERRAVVKKFLNRGQSQPDVHRTNGKRIYSPLTAMPRDIRKHISCNGDALYQIDAKNSQPLILIDEISKKGFDIEPELMEAVKNGLFYEFVGNEAHTRDKTKVNSFQFFFNSGGLNTSNPVYNVLQKKAPEFIKSLSTFMKEFDSLADHLQKLESKIWIDGVSTKLYELHLPHFTIHDSVCFTGRENINLVLTAVNMSFAISKPPLHVTNIQNNPINHTYEPVALQPIDAFKDLAYDENTNFPPPVPAIKIGGSWYGTLGNFSMIIGKAKSRKTFLISMLLGYTLKSYNLTGLIAGELPEDRNRAIIFDTEQAGFHAQQALKRAVEISGVSGKIKGYRLREQTPNERLEMIKQVISDTHNNTALYVIDGLRDLAQKGINDEETATIIATKLLQWTAKFNIHIIVLLHQNKNDTNARGHLGAEAVNKAEMVAEVAKYPDNKDISIVRCIESRNIEFDPFAFEIIDNIPEIVDMPIKEDNKKGLNPQNITNEMHIEIIENIFKRKSEYNSTDLKEQIIFELNEKRKTCGESKARRFLTYYESNDMIVNNSNNIQLKKWKIGLLTTR